MKALLQNYSRIAQESSGALALSLMESLVLVVFSRKLKAGHLEGVDLVFVWVVLAITAVALAFSACSIWQTIWKGNNPEWSKVVMLCLYLPVYSGVIFSGLITGGVILNY